jgi:hypothetical protein
MEMGRYGDGEKRREISIPLEKAREEFEGENLK